MEDLKMTWLWLAYDWTCQHTQGKVHIRLSTCRVASHSCLISSNPFTSKACPTPPSRSRSNAQDPRKHQLWQLLKVASTWTWPTFWWYKIRGNSYKTRLSLLWYRLCCFQNSSSLHQGNYLLRQIVRGEDFKSSCVCSRFLDSNGEGSVKGWPCQIIGLMWMWIK